VGRNHDGEIMTTATIENFVSIGNGDGAPATVTPCVDCGEPAPEWAFGVQFCEEHTPVPVTVYPSDWYKDTDKIERAYQIYQTAMRRILDSKYLSLEEVKTICRVTLEELE